MPRSAPRFDSRTIGVEINRGRLRREYTVTAFAKLLGIGRTHWYDKVDGTKPFTVDELGIIAGLLRAPKGWPVVPWDEGLEWENHLAETQRRRDEKDQRPHH